MAGAEPVSIFQCALNVISTPNTDKKAELTLEYAKLWAEGKLTHSGDKVSCPDEPARPDDITMVPPNKVKGGSKKAMIHALVHAESYAIDLSWDIILRFAQQPHINIDLGEAGKSLAGEFQYPSEFFDDWVKVAKEEAEHYSAWKGRLESLGSSYGELPVS